MCSARDDRTARAVIRDEALRLFARHGPDAVTIRQVAAAAAVSPGLVVHHFGGRDGLRRAVDEHVGAVFDDLFATMRQEDRSARSLAAAFVARLPADSPVPAYLRWLLLSGDSALFRRWFAVSTGVLDDLTAAGVLTEPVDPAVRSAFLMVNDLAVLLLRDRIADVLGVDPLSPDGMDRWATEAMAVYTHGVFRKVPS
jgi:TetR/AcrR family transcriptional regulator, regulator of cefoperazone and chloramphenicol sensitivity